MSSDVNELGGRVPLLEPVKLNAEQRSLYDSFVEHAVPQAKSAGFTAQLPDGRMVGPFNVSLYSPQIGEAFAKLQGVEGSKTTLDQRVRQVVILTVGALWQCDYERYAHRAVAQKAGLSQESIDALAQNAEPLGLSEIEALACEFTKQITTAHRVSPELFNRAQAAFGTEGIVDLLFLAGCYYTVCGLLNSSDIPVPIASRLNATP